MFVVCHCIVATVLLHYNLLYAFYLITLARKHIQAKTYFR